MLKHLELLAGAVLGDRSGRYDAATTAALKDEELHQLAQAAAKSLREHLASGRPRHISGIANVTLIDQKAAADALALILEHLRKRYEREEERRGIYLSACEDAVLVERVKAGADVARCQREKFATRSLLDPAGRLHVFPKLLSFAQTNDLPYMMLIGLMRGVHRQVQGWQLPEYDKTYELARNEPELAVTVASRGRVHRLVDPNGQEHTFTNLLQFTRTHGLDYAGAMLTLRGVHRHTGGGWHLPGVEPRAKTEYRMISPEGVEHRFTDAPAFSRKHSLSSGRGPHADIYHLLKGHVASLKGWTLPPDVKIHRSADELLRGASDGSEYLPTTTEGRALSERSDGPALLT